MEWLTNEDFSEQGVTPPFEDLGPLKRQLSELQLALMEVWEASEKYLRGMGYYEGRLLYTEAENRGRVLHGLLENPWAASEAKNAAPEEFTAIEKNIRILDDLNRRSQVNPYARLDGQPVFEPAPGVLYQAPPNALPADFACAEEPEAVPEKTHFWQR
jgi:hypothetical protein